MANDSLTMAGLGRVAEASTDFLAPVPAQVRAPSRPAVQPENPSRPTRASVSVSLAVPAGRAIGTLVGATELAHLGFRPGPSGKAGSSSIGRSRSPAPASAQTPNRACSPQRPS